MSVIRMSSKGQIVIPKAIRDRHGWHAGTELELEERGRAVVLQPRRRPRPSTVDEVRGILNYEGPPVSIEEMNEAVDRMFRKAWRKR